MSYENFNALLNGEINDIEDLPDFVNPPTGGYVGTVVKCEFGEWENKKKKITDGEITLQIQVTACMEDSPTDEMSAAIGNVVGFRFYGEFGVKQFKKLFKEAAEGLTITSLVDLITHLNNGQDLAVILKQRVQANPPVNGVDTDPSVFTDLKAVVLA